jgi:ABC-type Mn2+/Zn2+ transport system ATPase subunit
VKKLQLASPRRFRCRGGVAMRTRASRGGFATIPDTGVKSKGKALIKVVDVSFKYPRNDKVTIEKATVQVSLSSRVACIGPNGAGKSTLIKCLTGEVQPTTGTVWQHPNARIGYIAQHAFHHIEQRVSRVLCTAKERPHTCIHVCVHAVDVHAIEQTQSRR